jgi:hypothetical protein
MLDLTYHYTELAYSKSPGALPVLPPGTHSWQGIKFDVRGIARPGSLHWKNFAGITVLQKCSGIAFLYGDYGALTNASNDSTALVVHFANGHVETIPLVVGKDVASSMVDLNPPRLNLAMTNAVVWEKTISSKGVSRPYVVFYIKKWDNPFPEVPVVTLDFIPPPTGADPFLVAITVRPVNP